MDGAKWMGGHIKKKKPSIRRGKPVVREPLPTSAVDDTGSSNLKYAFQIYLGPR